MSDRRELNEDSEKMAVSYASGLPAHPQTLPSFRELLPPHLHDEIESTSYFTSPNHHSRERPASSSGRELAADPRSFPASPGYAHSTRTPLGDEPRSYPATPPRSNEAGPRVMGDYGSQHTLYREKPSAILPPIRDLQSVPDRSSNIFPEARGVSQPDQLPAQGLPGGHFSAVNERQSAGAYLGRGAAPVMHGQPPYAYPAVAYSSDSERPSSQMLPHSQQSNFGIMGDSSDSKNKRRRGNLPKPVTDILRTWFHEHLDHPYPSEEDKQMFMTRTGLSISQISNWFINARRRQLPALRNQMRSGGNGIDSQQQSFSSDEETESLPSPRGLPPTNNP